MVVGPAIFHKGDQYVSIFVCTKFFPTISPRQSNNNDGKDWHRRDVLANPLRSLYALPLKEECAKQLLISSKLLLLQLFRTEVDATGDNNPSTLVEKEDTLHALDDISSPSNFVVQADIVIFSPR